MLRLAAFLLCLLTPLGVTAQTEAVEEDVVLGLSQKRVRITANFDGSEILLFGAIKRNAPQPEGELDVIIAIAGPSEPVVVRRKERRFGIWINTESVDVSAAPSFYAVSSSRPLDEILSENANNQYRITADRAVWTLKSEAAFAEAVLRIRSNNGLYQRNEGAVEVAEQAMRSVGVEPLIQPIRGGTDGSQLSYKGLPCPNIFAGGHNFHGKFEYVPVESMKKAVEVIVKICELTASKPPDSWKNQPK